MGTTPLPSMPRSLAFDRRVCVAANRWGARRAVGVFFGVISRLGNGMFWYALMLALVALDGWRGLLVAAHMAATGLAALLLYFVARRARVLTTLPRRTFWGTDWSRLPCSYRQGVTMFIEEMPWLKGEDLEWVMGRGVCEWIGWRPDAPA